MTTCLLQTLRSDRGSVLIPVMVTGVVLALALAATHRLSKTSVQMSRFTRIKMVMHSVEVNVRSLALSTRGYTGCDSFNANSCGLNIDAFQSLAKAVTGAKCKPEVAACGVEVQNASYSPNTREFTADIVYAGVDYPVRPIQVRFVVPPEVLQSLTYFCPDTTPLFRGFNANGTPKCETLPIDCSLNPSQPDKYVRAINPDTLAYTCENIPSEVRCPANQFMRDFQWGGASAQFVVQCSPRISPFDYYSFTPNVSIQ